MTPALRGILLTVAAIGVFVCMDTIAKYLSRWYPVPGIVWARYVINLAFLLAWFAARGELGRIRTARPGIQLARGLLLAAATFLYFSSLRVLPLADAAAIGFVLPLFVAVLAVPMLGERLDPSRGVAIARRPGRRAADRAAGLDRLHLVRPAAGRHGACATRSTRSSRARSRASSTR